MDLFRTAKFVNTVHATSSLRYSSRGFVRCCAALFVGTALIGTLSSPVYADQNTPEWQRWKKTYVEKVLPIIQTKCLDCHGAESPDGEFDLSKYLDGDAAVKAGDAWERVARRVRLNEMPPPGSPGLNDPEKAAFHHWVDSRPSQDLCNQIASDETQAWYAGYVMNRRLTRTEYANALRDVTGAVVDHERLPPEDGGGGEGFDTSGASLYTSAIHLEAYLQSTNSVVEQLFAPNDNHSETKESANLVFERIQNLAGLKTENAEPILDAIQSGGFDSVQEVVRAYARLAWRRPVLDDELSKLRTVYDRSFGKNSDALESLKQVFKAILLSPNFLFVNEPEPEAPGVQRLSPHQFAMRMSLVIWSSIPDLELLELAENGDIFEPETVRAQIQRMLADDRARALGENFGLQWLGLRDFKSVKPDAEVFPDFDQEMADAALEESILFVSNIFRENRPLTDLLDSDYLFINDTLAEYYGIPWDGSDGWRKVQLEGEAKRRGGVSTMASVLIKTSYPRRTSPVLRGRWILEDILGARVPPPPPNVPALEEAGHGDDSLSLRQRLELHRKNPECASCHDRMDPLGFGLENFDAIGRWRVDDGGVPIDAEGTLPSGDKFVGAQELKQVLLKRKDEFYKHVTRKLVGFSLGRPINKFDQCIIDKSMERLHSEGRSTVILEEILLSYGFQHRYYSAAKDQK